MRYGLYIIALILLFLSACKPKAEQKQLDASDSLSVGKGEVAFIEPPLTGGNISLSEEDFGPLIELKGKQQLFDETGPIFKLSEPEVLIADGCFLFQNRPSGGGVYTTKDGTSMQKKGEYEELQNFFHWYRLPDFRYLVSMGRIGNGPSEFMFPHLVQSSNKNSGSYVYESTTGKLYATDTTGVLKYIPVEFRTDGNTYSDRQIVVATADTIYSADNTRQGRALYRSIWRGDSTLTSQLYDLSFSKKHKGWAAYTGDFIMSPSGNRMVYAYKYFHKLLVMDKEVGTIRDISFTEEGIDAKNNVETLKPDNVTYYWGATATEQYFFLAYSGRTPFEVSRENDKGGGYIFVEQYDWGGNPIARYRLDHWGKVFADSTTFYLLCYMYDDPLFLYEYAKKK